MHTSAMLKIAALGSVLSATIKSAPRIPERCCMAPEMPQAK